LCNGFRGRAVFISLVHYTGTSTDVPTHTHILFDRHSVVLLFLWSRILLFFSIVISERLLITTIMIIQKTRQRILMICPSASVSARAGDGPFVLRSLVPYIIIIIIIIIVRTDRKLEGKKSIIINNHNTSSTMVLTSYIVRCVCVCPHITSIRNARVPITLRSLIIIISLLISIIIYIYISINATGRWTHKQGYDTTAVSAGFN